MVPGWSGARAEGGAEVPVNPILLVVVVLAIAGIVYLANRR